MTTGHPRAAPSIRVVVETGSKRVFASAVDWPGWARSGRDEQAALEALVSYAPRYGSVVSRTRLGFVSPAGPSALQVLERARGNATTDYGAPGVPAKFDATTVGAADLARLQRLLTAGWRAFDAGVEAARGRTLRAGPRGGGRSLRAIVEHVRDAEAGYLSGLGWPFKSSAGDRDRLERTRAAVLEGLAASTRGEIAAKGPRGGVRWKPRFFVRRLMWHALDHLWEIEDRSA
jgi:DinB family protein